MDWNETPAERSRALAEQPVIMRGAHGKLYGIFTPPSPEALSADLCVILLGRNRWFGDRLSVKSARWLAARGFASLRFDYHGYGESEGDAQLVDTDYPYTEDALSAIRFMRTEFAQRRFVLSGFCFDGRTALSAIEEEGESLEAIVVVAALPGETASMYSNQAKATRAGGKPTSVPRVSDKFLRDLGTLVRSQVRCFFLYGTDDVEYHNFQIAERALLTNLDSTDRARLTIEVWPGRVHVAEDSDRMRAITERVLSWLDGVRYDSRQSSQSAAAALIPGAKNGFRA
ncbi:MAG TPA: alpha/beta hydrolase [Candidatus Binataceae bacterium]|nr:alpha/beta hydrolase [Candidatus Binataceae bacterium]